MSTTSLRHRVASVLVAVGALFVSACGSGDEPANGSAARDATSSSDGSGLPDTGHVHALRAAAGGGLLLGLHGALWHSPDGVDWELLGLEGLDAMAIGVATDDAPLLVAGHDVLARSTDGGETFERLSPPELPSLDIHALAQAPADPSTAYAFVVGHGVFRSDDAGSSWTPVTAASALPGDVAAMAVDPDDPQVVLAGSPTEGVFRSVDGGASFDRAADQPTIGLAFAGGGTALAATARGVDVSEDHGVSWDDAAPLEAFAAQPVAVAVDDAGDWWVITEEPRVLYRSEGSGSPFEEVARA